MTDALGRIRKAIDSPLTATLHFCSRLPADRIYFAALVPTLGAALRSTSASIPPATPTNDCCDPPHRPAVAVIQERVNRQVTRAEGNG